MYNKYMGGKDRMDENIHKYRTSIKCKKWWWVLFTFCIDTSIHNAWQLHRKYIEESNKIDYLKFRRTVVQTYLKLYGIALAGEGRPKSSKEVEFWIQCAMNTMNGMNTMDTMNHWIIPANKQNRCSVCKANARRACEKCDVYLQEKCFKTFHFK